MKTCKYKVLWYLFWVLAVTNSLSVTAQNYKVTGVVSDDSGPLPGVTIVEKGTNNGTMADTDGQYSISLKSGDAILEFSYVGYAKQSINVNNRNNINITMHSDVLALDGVVVIGYGTAKKRDLTGSIATVDSKIIGGQTVQNAAQAMQGKIAGVQITNAGSPGSTPQIRIRGLGTVTGGSNPLYVVDGVIVDNINYLGPNDIENISVMKDASSTAIYGVRAAGGVIMVTTKQGQYESKPTVSFNTYLGYKKISNAVEMANGQEYVTLYNEKMQQIGSDRRLDFKNFTSHNYLDDVLSNSWTNSQDLGISGGSSNVRYSFGLRHLKDDGLVNKNNFERVGFRSKFDVNINKSMRTGFSVILQSAKMNPVNSDVILQAYRALPIYAPKKSDGSWTDPNVDNVSGTMPNPTAANYYDHQWQTSIDAILNGYFEVDLFKDLTVKTNLSLSQYNSNYINFTEKHYVTEFQNSDKNNMSKSRNQNQKIYWDNTLTYSKRISKDHNLKAMIGTSYQTINTDYLNSSVQGLKDLSKITHNFLYLSMPRINEQYSATVNDDGDKEVVISYMGRLSYDYMGKYLFNFTAREDGSSKFPSYNRWGFFPSVGLGWVISEENFMKKFDKIDYMKLRASWGIMGNENIPNNLYVPQVDYGDYRAVIFGPAQNTGEGLVMLPATITQAYNSNLKWETTHEVNMGVDFGMLNSRLTSTIDFYSKTTKNAIFSVVALGSSGIDASGTWGNYATINNKGVELTLGWNDRKEDFSYSLSGNISYNKNNLKSVSINGSKGIFGKYDDTPVITYSVVGNPIGSFYGYKVTGIFQNTSEINSTPHLPGAKPGDLIYADLNGDKIVDEADRTFIGDPNPPLHYGFSASLGYKQFDLGFSLQGVAGNDIFNMNRMLRYGTENFDKDFVNNRWSGEGTSNKYPSAAWSNPTTPSSFYVESGSYLRVKSIQLGYTLPTELLKKVQIEQLRFYVNAENPFTFTKYNGFSPEVSGTPIMSGVDRNTYPLSSVYSFGVNLTF